MRLKKKGLQNYRHGGIRAGRNISPAFLKDVCPDLAKNCLAIQRKRAFTLTEAIYEYFFGRPRCVSCQRIITKKSKVLKFPQIYHKHCSEKCAGADETVASRRAKTCRRLYGVDAVQQVPEIRAKFRKSMLKKYGAEHTASSEKLHTKMRKTLKKNYGVSNPFKSSKVMKKVRRTMKERYGVEHLMQSRQHFEKQQKAGFKIRSVRISGKTFRVRGYEPLAIKYLAKKGCSTASILTTAAEGVPAIPWTDKRYGTKHYYHPDMYVKYKNKWMLIEVKSTYTVGAHKAKVGGRAGEWYRVRKKAAACVAAGFRFKLLVVGERKNGAIVAEIDDAHLKGVVQIRRELATHHLL